MTTSRTLQPEDVLAHYRVVGPLGAGGMGEVYLAQDSKLDRNVALKVLPQEFVRDDERLRRFVLEAKSASSLSHPNIVTIYEIGSDVVRARGGAAEPDSSPVQFISMELINGRTLTTLIHEDRTDLRALVGYLAQAAEGLAKAHSAGIVHRDLKPGNIMVSNDGFAKVLDFGLAKLTERSELSPDMTSAPTRIEPHTGSGTVMGTTWYMSPEQVRGKPVDQRSDVFSFGCVLYEAATGVRPFSAETGVETMHKILNEPPRPIEEVNKRVPAELRRIIRRCLAKSPDQRFQSMKDVAIELREVVDEWDNLTSTATGPGVTAPGRLPAAAPARTRWIVGGALLVAVAAIGVAVWSMRRGGAAPTAAVPPSAVRISTETDRGDIREAAISRDGRYLAYLAGETGRSSVRVRQVATGSDLEVVPSEEGIFQGLSFSPDGNYLFYLKRRRDAPNYRALMQVASLGGESRERAFDVDSRASFSPDGTRIVFTRGEPQRGRDTVVIRELESGKERLLAAIPQPRRLMAAPDWSPDGRRIAAATIDGSKGSFQGTVFTLDAETGAEEDLETFKGSIPESVAWLPDGRGIVRTGYNLPSAVNRQVTIVPYPKDRTRPVTSDGSDYLTPTTGADAIAAVRTIRLSDLVVVSAAGGDSRPLTSFRNPDNSPYSVSVCPDGTVMFSAQRDRTLRIWSLPAGGGSPKPLTEPGVLSVNPRCFAGGFVMDRYDNDGEVHVWRADPDGGNARNVSPGRAAEAMDVAHDGSAATFEVPGTRGLWVTALPGGEPRLLSDDAGWGRFSNDGAKIVIGQLAARPDGLITNVYKIVPTAGGAPVGGPKAPSNSENLRWTPDDAGISYIDQSGPIWNLFVAPVDGGPVRPLTTFKEGRITEYTFSPDGRKLALALTIGKDTNVWISAADGTKPEQLTKYRDSDVFDLSWMPDSANLIVNIGSVRSDAVLLRDFR